jgi:uncharacterized membrane protein YhaH (DUF805 family)
MQDMSPIGWALRPLKNYAKFSGRASRAEFWWFFLFVMLIYFGALFAVGGLGRGLASMNPGADLVRGTFSGSLIVVGLFWLFLFIPTLAVQIRRLHDTNRSGWWLGAFWLLYVVYMGLTFSLMSVAMRSPGTPPNMGGFAAIGIFAILFFVYSIVLLVFFCLRGTPGPNRFGDDPYGANVEEVFA